MEKEATPKKEQKRFNRRLVLFVTILLAINFAAQIFAVQLDLTDDKRYTITDATKAMMHELPQKVEVIVFLTGDDMPAAFKRLEKSTESLLKKLRSLSDNKLSYRFVDPLAEDTMALQTLSRFRMSGIPVTVDAGKKGSSQKMIFPWALALSHAANGEDRAFPVFLQESNTPELSRTILNKSEMLLEYNIANAVNQVVKKKRPAIAYFVGNDEEFGFSVSSAIGSLLPLYHFDTLSLGDYAYIPKEYDAVIINRPLKAFDEIDKFKIDQYLMGGGSLFLNIDAATGSLDSFSTEGRFNSMPIDLNLSDLFFQYGFRINTNLIEDAVNCVGVPLMAPGENAQTSMYPWVYFPVLQNGSDHPIVKNLSGVLGRFVSSIDTIESGPEVKKTILLQTSPYSATASIPAPIILETAIVEKNPANFKKKNLIAGLLLEGPFRSAFAGRLPPEVRSFIDSTQQKVLAAASPDAKIIVASDGQIIMNEYSERNGPSEMGIYRFSDYRFDNKSFMLNSLEYLSEDNNLLGARTKSFKTRLLDPKRVSEERGFWQLINVGIPILSVLLLGGIYFFSRNKSYG